MIGETGTGRAPLRDVYLGLGSNVGDRARFLAAAVQTLRGWAEVDEAESSALYESDYVGSCTPQGAYLNLCVRLRTSLDLPTLLARTQELERGAGRDPGGHELPRTLDIDLLLDGGRMIDAPGLRIPHPRMRGRRFVLQPLCDLCPELRLPPDGVTVAELLRALDPGVQPLRRWEVLA